MGSLIYFYDTCSLLRLQERAFSGELPLPFWVSSVTFKELEEIKDSGYKDEEVKTAARNLLRLFNAPSNQDKFCIHIVTQADKNWVHDNGFVENNDALIIASMSNSIAAAGENAGDSLAFVTDDLSCRMIAKAHGLKTEVVGDADTFDEYKGWRVIEPSEDELAQLYSGVEANLFNLVTNEYAVVKQDGKTVDLFRWDGTAYRHVSGKPLKSKAFDTIKPKDDFQKCAIDALTNCEMVALAGKAGCGKTLLTMAYLFQQMEIGKIHKLWIVGHFEPLRGSRQLGFHKGNKLEKMLATGSLGNILSTKLGGLANVQNYIYNDRIEIVPASDLRGMEFGAGNIGASPDAVWVTEAQDCDGYTLGTVIQRCKAGTKIVIEGDMRQIDIYRQSGFERMVDIFKGDNKFGFVKLKEDYRNPLGALAEKLMQ